MQNIHKKKSNLIQWIANVESSSHKFCSRLRELAAAANSCYCPIWEARQCTKSTITRELIQAHICAPLCACVYVCFDFWWRFNSNKFNYMHISMIKLFESENELALFTGHIHCAAAINKQSHSTRSIDRLVGLCVQCSLAHTQADTMREKETKQNAPNRNLNWFFIDVSFYNFIVPIHFFLFFHLFFRTLHTATRTEKKQKQRRKRSKSIYKQIKRKKHSQPIITAVQRHKMATTQSVNCNNNSNKAMNWMCS